MSGRAGCFAVRLARAVPGGGVTAIDIEPNMVRFVGMTLIAVVTALGCNGEKPKPAKVGQPVPSAVEFFDKGQGAKVAKDTPKAK